MENLVDFTKNPIPIATEDEQSKKNAIDKSKNTNLYVIKLLFLNRKIMVDSASITIDEKTSIKSLISIYRI